MMSSARAGATAALYGVGRAQRVVDVADRHHTRLNRDCVAGHPSWVSLAVELLVVSVRDHGDVLELTSPGDLLQEPVGVGDVAFDFQALRLVE